MSLKYWAEVFLNAAMQGFRIQNFRKGELCCPFMTPREMTEQFDFLTVENHQVGTS